MCHFYKHPSTGSSDRISPPSQPTIIDLPSNDRSKPHQSDFQQRRRLYRLATPATPTSIPFTTITLQPVYPDLDPFNSNSLRSRLHFDISTRNKIGNRLLHTTAPRRADVTLTIDGKEVTVPQGTALIQACVSAEIRFNPIDPFSDRGLLTSDMLFHPS
jgi:hypothetical protein